MMPASPTVDDYKSDPRRDKTAHPLAADRPPDLIAVEEFLQLLGRAVRQFHTYPATSPLCIDVVEACHKTLVALENRDRVAFRVTPRELIVDDIGIGAGTVVEQELVRRLHRSGVAAMDVGRHASPRDLTRFCSDINRCDEYAKAEATLADMLTEHGVDAIILRMAHRPEVLDLGVPQAPLRELMEAERRHRKAAPAPSGPVQHLYPPEKGWVRVDPTARFDTISLVDLAILVDDPAQFASMLLRLTDDEPVDERARELALEQKFSDVAMMFASFEPRLARVMFSKLAHAVLDLDPARRKELLQRTVLPGLLDGRADGMVLRDFPDLDLAESLFLLLDLETAAPEVLTTALERLDLPAERRENVVPLLEARMRNGAGVALREDARNRGLSIERYARRLIRVDAAAAKSFVEFSSFDLSIDDQAARAIAAAQETIAATDIAAAQLRCLWNLAKLEPNPRIVHELLRRALVVFGDLERARRWTELAAEMSQYSSLAENMREARPDVTETIGAALDQFWTPDRAMHLGELYESGADGKAIASALVHASPSAIAAALIALLDAPTLESRARVVVPLMCQHARVLARALTPRLDGCGVAAARMVVRMLGYAGHGAETAVAAQLGRRDEQTDREALRALARIGTPKAAAVVAEHLQHGNSGTRVAAEEALWHFPPPQTAAQVLEILGRRDFVLHNPETAGRLLDRAGQIGAGALQPVLPGLTSLRYRFWNPAVVRVARKARGLLGKRPQLERGADAPGEHERGGPPEH